MKKIIVIVVLTIGLAAMAAGTWAVQSAPHAIGKFFNDTPMKTAYCGKDRASNGASLGAELNRGAEISI